jgi:hypothetical protein
MRNWHYRRLEHRVRFQRVELKCPMALGAGNAWAFVLNCDHGSSRRAR